MEGQSRLVIKGTVLGREEGAPWDGKRMNRSEGSTTVSEPGIEGCESSVGVGQSQNVRKAGGSAELGRRV